MKKLTVALPERPYEIWLAEGLLSEPERWLDGLAAPGRPLPVVTDENVWRQYGESFLSGLNRAGFRPAPVALPPGEGNKSLEGASRLYQAFAEMKLNRGDLIIAFGGGVIGDLAGFAAATWMRGIGYIQVPTSLLAQVDSSVGGKTALNLPYGKNMIGAFHQPKRVVIDPDTLKTLPPRELSCGLGEVVKYGAIRSPGLAAKLEEGPPYDWEAIIHECCSIKAGIVARDEFDAGERALLNFGHSFGHALESLYQYRRFNHGEAVALGMIIAANIGEEMGLTEPGVAEKLISVLTANRLPSALPCSPLELLPYLAADKKSEGDRLRLVLLKRIGEAVTKTVGFGELAALAGKAAASASNMDSVLRAGESG